MFLFFKLLKKTGRRSILDTFHLRSRPPPTPGLRAHTQDPNCRTCNYNDVSLVYWINWISPVLATNTTDTVGLNTKVNK